MTVHHGLDLADVKRRLGTHSIFGPSSAAMWLLCSGSLIPHLMAEDDANEDAAYGTVGHEVGETWLKKVREYKDAATWQSLIDFCRPQDLVGTTVTVVEGSGRSFDIEIDDEMLDYVREYVVWCANLGNWNDDHYVEQRVDISDLTPIPDQSGTADHAYCSWQLLIITDLKMGRERVYARWNYQGLLYAYGFFREWDWLYNFQTIIIRIAQPRLGHFDVWEITREELLAFAEWVKVRAALAWQPNAPRTPGKKQCRWCRVAETCAASIAFLDREDGGVFDDLDEPEEERPGDRQLTIEPDGTISGVSYTVKDLVAVDASIRKPDWQPTVPDETRMSTEAMAKLLPHRKRIERFFTRLEEELTARALAGEEIPGFKLVTGRAGRRAFTDEAEAEVYIRAWAKGATEDEIKPRKLQSPAAMIELVRRKRGITKKFAEELIDSLVTRPAGRDTLVQEIDKREALPAPGDVFDDLDAAEGI